MDPRDAPTAAARVERAEWRRRRRQAARAHHPDHGGDVESYLQALAAVDAYYGLRGTTRTTADRYADIDQAAGWPRSFPATRRTRLVRRLRRHRRVGRRRVRAVQAGLPRWVPGSRRFIDITT